MEEQDVIRRLKGLGRGATPPAPDFADATLPTPVAKHRGVRLGVAPLAAVVGVLALAAAALAVPQAGPLRQVVAGLSTEIQTDVADVEADLDVDLNESGGSGSAGTDLCAEPPAPIPTNIEGTEVPEGGGVEGGASVEVSPEDREAQVRAWREWRQANCDMTTDSGGDSGGDSTDDDKSDKTQGRHGDGHPGRGSDNGQGDSQGNPPTTHPHEDDPCKGPPPHSNKPGTGDPDRDEERRKAEQEAWHQWHKENCPPGQTGDHAGGSSGQGRPDDAGKPDDAGPPEGKGEGRPDGTGKPEGRP